MMILWDITYMQINTFATSSRVQSEDNRDLIMVFHALAKHGKPCFGNRPEHSLSRTEPEPNFESSKKYRTVPEPNLDGIKKMPNRTRTELWNFKKIPNRTRTELWNFKKIPNRTRTELWKFKKIPNRTRTEPEPNPEPNPRRINKPINHIYDTSD
jgi:hypothetical protein